MLNIKVSNNVTQTVDLAGYNESSGIEPIQSCLLKTFRA